MTDQDAAEPGGPRADPPVAGGKLPLESASRSQPEPQPDPQPEPQPEAAPDPGSPLERLRHLCLSLPETFEQMAWSEPTFRVRGRGRLFAMYAAAGNHHGAGRNAVWCNAPVGIQEELIRSAPDRFFVPPYVGVKGWIGVDLAKTDDEELSDLLLQSYCMVAPARLQRLADRRA